MRNPSKAPQLGQLEALVMECANEADVRDIYRKFLEVGQCHFIVFIAIYQLRVLQVSKRSKLERHRRRKSDGGSSVITKSVEALFSSNNVKNASR